MKNSLSKNLSFGKMVNEILETVIKDCECNCSDTDTWELCKIEIPTCCAVWEKALKAKKEMTIFSDIYMHRGRKGINY